MLPCPFCAKPMHPTLTGGLLREHCGACGAVWFEGGTLAKVLGTPTAEALVEQARGKPGQCKGCQGTLEYVPSCPACGTSAPSCPRCGTSPLAMTTVTVAKEAEVAVDVCTRCQGVALDPGELEVLQQAAEAERETWLEEMHEGPKVLETTASTCAGCGRPLKPQHAFTWEERTWCGSCAPAGASPVEIRLTPRTPNGGLDADLSDLYQSGRTGMALEVVGDAVSSAFSWLFSKLLR
ncbi:zf-TFIIB domain-containing protein [Archangium lipolyticum]|uniref:zf-TFIIB domain-containing protein n=1 Tax=Archangium lipolyticum TaxID=2970465 RepID=UPI00214A56FF|nr:zf-TFIIB domain-containing protein [Archangium lipolyticum]